MSWFNTIYLLELYLKMEFLYFNNNFCIPVNCVFFSVVLRTLRQLCTSTSILTDPALLPEEAKQAVLDTKTHSS